MSQRNRLRNIVFGIAVVLAVPALGQDTDQPLEGAAQNQETDETIESQPTDKLAVEVPSAASPIAPAESSGENHDNRSQHEENDDPDEPARPSEIIIVWGDTPAQWVMAVSGVAAVFISMWAVYLLKKTLRATRDAVTEAKKATKAAEDAVTATREGTERQLRAYVSVVSIMAERPVDNVLKFTMTVKNTGQTPAYGINFANVVFPGGPAAFDLPAPDRDEGLGDLGAGVTKIFPVANFGPTTNQQFDEIMSRRLPLYVWGAVYYWDIYREIHRYTRYRMIFVQHSSELAPLTEGNESN